MERKKLSATLLAWALLGCAHVQAAPPAPSPTPSVPADAPSSPPSATESESGTAPGPPATGVESEASPETKEETAQEEEASPAVAPDPFRLWNRAMYTFNDRLYFWLLKPVARGYKAVFPSPVRAGVKNFFHNVTTPGRLVNDVLQARFRQAGIELGRFMINTTWGLLGLVDWTGHDPELQPPAQDTGLTLGRYGIGAGPFIMWPFLGPSTLRDSAGQVGDFFLDPTWYVKPWTASLGVTAVREVSDVSYRIGDYEALKDAAIDPYEAVRDAYLQHRAAELKK